MAGDSHSIHTFEVSRKSPKPLKFYSNVAKRWCVSSLDLID